MPTTRGVYDSGLPGFLTRDEVETTMWQRGDQLIPRPRFREGVYTFVNGYQLSPEDVYEQIQGIERSNMRVQQDLVSQAEFGEGTTRE